MSARLLLLTFTVLGLSLLLSPIGRSGGTADPVADITELKLKDWEPKSMMVTKTTIVEKPLYPVVDMHNHLGAGKQRVTPEAVKKHLTEMDEAGVRTVVTAKAAEP